MFFLFDSVMLVFDLHDQSTWKNMYRWFWIDQAMECIWSAAHFAIKAWWGRCALYTAIVLLDRKFTHPSDSMKTNPKDL